MNMDCSTIIPAEPAECKWMSDNGQEICCNGECAVCADFCPLVNYPAICTYYEEKDDKA